MKTYAMQLCSIVLLMGTLVFDSDQFEVDKRNAARKIAKQNLTDRALVEEALVGGVPPPPSGPNEPRTAGEYILYFMQAVCAAQSCSYADVKAFAELPLNLGVSGFDTFSQHCREEVDCSTISREYRTIDGTCNNLKDGHSLYGSSGTPIERFLDPVYSDYISEPRKYGVNGEALAPARFISERLLPNIKILNDKLTTMVVYYGQFIAHDFVQTDIIKLNGDAVPCCTGQDYDGCIEMPVSSCDPFYSQFGVDCISLARSKATVSLDCTFDQRENENVITHFIDASFLYGSNDALAASLKNPSTGKMKKTSGKLLPLISANGCTFADQNCNFLAGDNRVNENAALSIFHTVFLREHNRLVNSIKALEPTWDAHKLYEEARKIIGAMTQSITYREYLPVIVGPAAMSEFDITVGNVPDNQVYDKNLSPTVKSSFATAAFRFGHATIPEDFKLVFDDGTDGSMPIQNTFLGPWQLYEKQNFDSISRGMTSQCPRITSVFMASSVNEQLDNKRAQNDFGSDLGATNIQRGRDHGLPPWNDFREFCGLPRYNSFEDIPDICPATLASLMLSYDHVDDIDLFVGGLLEKSVDGGSVGETFACLNAKQFEILKNGDRYFYTNGAGGSKKRGFKYTAAQIEEFNKASVARLFCDHTGITEIQAKALEKADSTNPVVDCNTVPELDIALLIS